VPAVVRNRSGIFYGTLSVAYKMGILRRGKNLYYYKSTRIKGKVVNTLIATGEAAEYYALASRHLQGLKSDAAAEVREERRIERERRSELRAWRAECDEAEQSVVELTGWSEGLASAALEASGYRRRRGEWRKPRARKPMVETSELQPAAVEPGGVQAADPFGFLGADPMLRLKEVDGKPSIEIVEHKPNDLETVMKRMSIHFDKCERFEASEIPRVKRAFANYERTPPQPSINDLPDSPKRCFLDIMIDAHQGSPVLRAESALIRRMATGKGGLYCEEAMCRRLVDFKAELLGDSPTAIERALVDVIGCAWLDAMASEEHSAEITKGAPALLEYLERRKDRSTRRLLKALKTLAEVRRKLPPAVALQVNVNTPGSPTATLDVIAQTSEIEGSGD
jgi:hypothetical protein